MAIIKQGILGGFNGKVGTVIGSTWKGRAVIRSVAQHVHNPRTEAQQAARARMSLVSRMVSAVYTFVSEGFRAQADREAITSGNVATRLNLAQAVTGSGTNVSLDYNRVMLSQGSLLNVESPSATVAASGHSVNVSWTNNAGVDSDVLDNDQVLFCLYNPTRQASIYDLVTACRDDQSAVLHYPALWAGDTLYLYVATRSEDKTRISNSIMAGSVVAV